MVHNTCEMDSAERMWQKTKPWGRKFWKTSAVEITDWCVTVFLDLCIYKISLS